MPIRRFHVEGYRSLADVTLDFGDVTVVAGPNGSGKTNLYRALRLAHECAEGRLARAIVREGGMPSVVCAARRKGEPRIDLAVDLDDMTYAVSLVTLGRGIDEPGAGSFLRDPVIRQEQILLPGKGKRRVEMVDRAGASAFVRDADGHRVVFPASLHPSEPLLVQLVDARQFPELVYVRETLRQMRFHHHVRTDDEAPARRPGMATRTLAVSDDGADLAAALLTIQREGDGATLARCVEEAFEGARLEVAYDEGGRLDVLLHVEGMMRPLSAPELSDGQLRLLFLAAALLSQRPPVMVVLNEPETSLHVRLLPALAELVAAAAERTQVVLTTHASSLATALLDKDGCVGVQLELRAGATRLAAI